MRTEVVSRYQTAPLGNPNDERFVVYLDSCIYKSIYIYPNSHIYIYIRIGAHVSIEGLGMD